MIQAIFGEFCDYIQICHKNWDKLYDTPFSFYFLEFPLNLQFLDDLQYINVAISLYSQVDLMAR